MRDFALALMYSGMLTVPPTVATFDHLLDWYLFFGVGAAVVVIGMLVTFVILYRDKGDNKPLPEHKTEGWKIVLITVMISISILAAAEYQTFASFSNIETPSQCSIVPDPCINISVLGFQWGWQFTYPNGKVQLTTEDQPLTVPVDRIILLNITSRDVFHSFGIVSLAVKEDAIPGRYNTLWFNDTNLGLVTMAIRCYELCGAGHATMVGNLSVVPYSTWQSEFGVNTTG